MNQIPVSPFPRQSLSVVLENTLYELSLKECNGIMAVSVVRDGATIVSNRRAVAGEPVIPHGYLEEGNFILLTDKEALPYYTDFEGATLFVYITRDELTALRGGAYV
ncbi:MULTISPECIES: phage baseplate plug family protein [Franconibacter]|uniref:phage baseplate plug family protein n=1 Tax=Franconibacter TaxID=1649295 RepID=UPI001FF8AB60|nr:MULTISPECIES: hypothetical protein [Franconibacter]MCK1967161.1 hypothetical protein [Franconibacter sp. IITDAS19]MEB5921433.1 hypothetical protein [Franconibacter daqui]